MKWFAAIAALAAVLLGGTYWYFTAFSATARAEAAAKAFVRQVTAGDMASLEALLAPEARPNASQIAADFKGLTPSSFHVSQAQPNQSGVQIIVLVSFVRPTGTTGTLLLAMREAEKQWVVTQAGKDLIY